MSQARAGLTSAIVLGYGEEPWLEECLAAILASEDVELECLLVDNGVEGSRQFPDDSRLRVLRPDANSGFAGGCNLGAAAAGGDVLVFVNSDAIVAPDALAVLRAAVAPEDIGLVTASVRLGDRPDRINAAGNPMQFLGFTWAGGMGDPVADHQAARDVTCISGATFAVRAEVWRELGGFDEEYFAYGEDTDISIRTWQSGRRVRFEPRAVALHHYEFSRNPSKWFLLERGRLINVLTLYEPRTRRYVMPAFVTIELATMAAAATQGWAPQKWAAWSWAWSHRDYLRARSRRVQAARRVPDREILGRIQGDLTPAAEFGQRVPGVVNRSLSSYWAWCRRRLGAGDAGG